MIDPIDHLQRIIAHIETAPPGRRAERLESLLRQYELLRQRLPLLDAFAAVATAPSSKAKLIKQQHDALKRTETHQKRAKRSRATRTLQRYAIELLRLKESGFGCRALEKWIWSEHRKKISYRTICRWLKEQESK